jgi:methyl-accepting chemotaxis protein
MEKIVSATKDGAEKVCDTVKRTATTNAADNSQTIPLAVKAIHKGLMDVSETTARIAEHLIDHPDEMRGATEAAESIGKRFSELVEAVSQYDQGTSKLKGMVGEMAKTADWIDYRFSHAESNQSGMAVPSVSVNNTFCGRIFNAGATAPPCVGDFNELFGYNR